MYKQVDPLNRQKSLLLSTIFEAKCELVFVLTWEIALSLMFHFKTKRKNLGSSKTCYYRFLK